MPRGSSCDTAFPTTRPRPLCRERSRSISLLVVAVSVAIGLSYLPIRAGPGAKTGPRVVVDVARAHEVRDVRYTLDGLWLTTFNRDAIAQVWELSTGRQVATTGGHDREIRTEALSPDGRWLARGRKDSVIELWWVETFRNPRELRGHRGRISALEFDPDGKRLASCGADGTVRLWAVDPRSPPRVLRGHDGAVTDVAFGRDGRFLASAGADGTIALWNPRSGRLVRRWTGHDAAATAVAFDVRGRWLASGGDDGAARIWDPDTGRPVAVLASTREGDDWVAVSADGRFDGTPDALEHLVRLQTNSGASAPPIELVDGYLDPGVLARLLRGRREAPRSALRAADLACPRVELRSAPASRDPTSARRSVVDVELTVVPVDTSRALAEQLRVVRLYRNGRLVREWPADRSWSTAGGTVLTASVRLAGSRNVLSAHAVNERGVRGREDTLDAGAPAAGALRRRTAHVLAVGVDRYGKGLDLAYSAAGARALAAKLSLHLREAGLFETVSVTTLLDDAASRERILGALDRLAGGSAPVSRGRAAGSLEHIRPARPDDAVFLYFAAYGATQGERFYLLPHMSGYSGGGTGLSHTVRPPRGAVSDRELRRSLSRIDAANVVLILDTCHRGPLHGPGQSHGALHSRGLARLALDAGVWILAAAQGRRAAVSASRDGQGYLTYALLAEGLEQLPRGRPFRERGVVVRDWLEFAVLRVGQLQAAAMLNARAAGDDLSFVDGERGIRDIARRTLPRPRVFAPRETHLAPLWIWRPTAAPGGADAESSGRGVTRAAGTPRSRERRSR